MKAAHRSLLAGASALVLLAAWFRPASSAQAGMAGTGRESPGLITLELGERAAILVRPAVSAQAIPPDALDVDLLGRTLVLTPRAPGAAVVKLADRESEWRICVQVAAHPGTPTVAPPPASSPVINALPRQRGPANRSSSSRSAGAGAAPAGEGPPAGAAFDPAPASPAFQRAKSAIVTW